MLGRDLYTSEQLFAATGIPTTVLRCAMFYGALARALCFVSALSHTHCVMNCVSENHWGNAPSIQAHNAFFYPAKATVPVQSISLSDIGEATAAVIAAAASASPNTPNRFAGKTLWLGGPALTWDEVAGVFSKVLGRTISFVSVPDQAALKVHRCPHFSPLPRLRCVLPFILYSSSHSLLRALVLCDALRW